MTTIDHERNVIGAEKALEQRRAELEDAEAATARAAEAAEHARLEHGREEREWDGDDHTFSKVDSARVARDMAELRHRKAIEAEEAARGAVADAERALQVAQRELKNEQDRIRRAKIDAKIREVAGHVASLRICFSELDALNEADDYFSLRQRVTHAVTRTLIESGTDPRNFVGWFQ